jgi:CheY-like chemotaxis protein
MRTSQRGNGRSMFLQTEASGESEGILRRSLRIIIADDDYDTIDTLTVILRDEGHEVFGVHDGPSVVPLTRKLRPDAVILDIGMPKLSGYDVARMLKEEYGSRCPTLIAVTAYSRQPDKLIGKAVGFDHYFGKPVVIDELLAALPKAKPRNH